MASDKKNYLSQQPTRKAWQGMMNRCYTKTNKDYPNVGGRGITVCPEWHDYNNFLRDMGEKPSDGILKRYCNALGFTPSNTYWFNKIYVATNRLYTIWKGMRRRCGYVGSRENKSTDYIRRGVELHEDWALSFDKFANDVGEPPSDTHTLDRVDNNRGYIPGNVRWTTAKVQANNRSDNIYIEMGGERRTFQQWCDFHGVDNRIAYGRWRKLFLPNRGKNRVCLQYTLENELVAEYAGIKEAATKTGIRQGTIAKCLSGGNASAGGYVWRYKQ